MDSVVYSDDQILELVRESQTFERGFRLLMNKYQERLYWHIRRMVHSHEDTDDILQNTFVKVYKNLSKYRSESKLYTWLYRIATNEALTHIRKAKKSKALSLDDADTQIISLKADDYFDGNRAQMQLAAAIEILPEKQKLVFNMRYYQDMTYNDISEVLSTSVGALKASYHHAVKKIENYINRGK